MTHDAQKDAIWRLKQELGAERARSASLIDDLERLKKENDKLRAKLSDSKPKPKKKEEKEDS